MSRGTTLRFKLFNNTIFVLWQNLRLDLVDTEGACDDGGGVGGAAGQHDDTQAFRVQAIQGSLGGRLDWAGHSDDAGGLTIDAEEIES